MNLKNKIGLSILIILLVAVLWISIKLFGHKHSLGILFIGLLCIDLFVMLFAFIVAAFKIIRFRHSAIFCIIITLSLIAFIIYHRSYDSYNETRSIFWGINGEKNVEIFN